MFPVMQSPVTADYPTHRAPSQGRVQVRYIFESPARLAEKALRQPVLPLEPISPWAVVIKG